MKYLVISADCHAGLPNAQYRDWLDPGNREAFDEYLRQREAMLELAGRGLLNEEFAAAIGAVFLVCATCEAALSPFIGRFLDRRGVLLPVRVSLALSAVLSVGLALGLRPVRCDVGPEAMLPAHIDQPAQHLLFELVFGHAPTRDVDSASSPAAGRRS